MLLLKEGREGYRGARRGGKVVHTSLSVVPTRSLLKTTKIKGGGSWNAVKLDILSQLFLAKRSATSFVSLKSCLNEKATSCDSKYLQSHKIRNKLGEHVLFITE